jgi:hypothetical protein
LKTFDIKKNLNKSFGYLTEKKSLERRDGAQDAEVSEWIYSAMFFSL